MVFTLPAPISAIAYTNKELIYGLLFDIAAETLRTIAADPKHFGARIGTTLVLHTWGSALTHHPHVHGIVPGRRPRARCRALGAVQAGVLPLGAGAVAALSASLPRRARERSIVTDNSSSSASTSTLADTAAFADWLAPLRQCEWVVYAKRPFSGPEQVLAYLSRYTHRVAISNSRLVALDDRGVTFRWKDYRAQGRTRYKTMTLGTEEFMRRFLLHVLPSGFHRIRHYGLLANANRKHDIAAARELLHQPPPEPAADPCDTIPGHGSARPTFVCRHCGAPMIIIETFARAQHIRGPPMLSYDCQPFLAHFIVATSSQGTDANARCLAPTNVLSWHASTTPPKLFRCRPLSPHRRAHRTAPPLSSHMATANPQIAIARRLR